MTNRTKPKAATTTGFHAAPTTSTTTAGRVRAGNGHFSDSEGSSNELPIDVGGGESDESGREPATGADVLRSGRGRRSWGIPSLISRQGSRSNLGIDTGISRAHELIR